MAKAKITQAAQQAAKKTSKAAVKAVGKATKTPSPAKEYLTEKLVGGLPKSKTKFVGSMAMSNAANEAMRERLTGGLPATKLKKTKKLTEK